jgi:hypothetical protein
MMTTTSSSISSSPRFSGSDSTTFDDDNNTKFQCHPAGNDATGCNDNETAVNLSNGREESCLLGIDCNENTKTTVGMVLRVLADTAIRLDGDG